MDKQIKVSITDRNKIKSVTCKHPGIVNEDACDKVKAAYYELVRIQNELYDYRDIVRSLEKRLDNAKKEFESMSQIFNIEFETNEKLVTTHKSNLVLNGDLVYQYHH